MKKNVLLISCSATLVFVSCDGNDDNAGYTDYLMARPLVMGKAEFSNSVNMTSSRPVNEYGKIYTYQDLIFINDKI